MPAAADQDVNGSGGNGYGMVSIYFRYLNLLNVVLRLCRHPTSPSFHNKKKNTVTNSLQQLFNFKFVYMLNFFSVPGPKCSTRRLSSLIHSLNWRFSRFTASQDHVDCRKDNFKLFLRSNYNKKKVEFPLFSTFQVWSTTILLRIFSSTNIILFENSCRKINWKFLIMLWIQTPWTPVNNLKLNFVPIVCIE